MRWLMARGALRWLFAGGMLLLVGVLAGCGASSIAPAASSSQHGKGISDNQGSGATTAGPAATPGTSGTTGTTSVTGGQYVIKALEVDLKVKEPRRVADDIQAWISATDPKSTTVGSDYEQLDANNYRVTTTFSVQAILYPQIARYLRDYTTQRGGQLLSLRETVSDVTNDYVDTQSRLSNLRVEQQRLQALLSRAQALSDVLAIEQRLTDVEGQIEQIEAHLNALNGQVTFYQITVMLEPSSAATPVPQSLWNPLSTLTGALQAAVAFGEWLLSTLIWLVVFSLFLLPAALVVWLI
ncbi:MAG: DUF4349 domain-containing protein, partial [Ktedonobacterales bacterium]|nr:DUF4349 domain-containing protein [Ktedonobacterales bacterium]